MQQFYKRLLMQLNQLQCSLNKMRSDKKQKKINHSLNAFAEVMIAFNGIALLFDSRQTNNFNYYISQYIFTQNLVQVIRIFISACMIAIALTNNLNAKVVSITCFSYYNLLCHNIIDGILESDFVRIYYFLLNILVVWMAVSSTIDTMETKIKIKVKSQYQDVREGRGWYPFEPMLLKQQESIQQSEKEVVRIAQMVKVPNETAKEIVKKIQKLLEAESEKIVFIGQKKMDFYIKKETKQIEQKITDLNSKIEQIKPKQMTVSKIEDADTKVSTVSQGKSKDD